MESDQSWILFTYRIASEPSTVRVRAWRILRRIGALALQQSTCIVPNTALVVRKLQQLQLIIKECGGDAHWIDIQRLAPQTEVELIQQFNHERANEYSTLVEACERLPIDESLATAEVELKNLQKSFAKLRDRDYFHCPLASTAEIALAETVQRFQRHLERAQT